MTEQSLPEESIFLHALDLESAADRAAYLDQACGGDAKLRAQVEALLRAHSKSGDLLDLSESPDATIDQPITEKPGVQIGPYKLLQQIGEGGFGVVYMAEQTEPVKRRVALKIIKPGMDTRQVIARFEAERQALAMMDHPNISKVFDAGATDSGRPYFVMELVKGVPITQFCDEKQLTPRERLELFVPVCQAVQHAHQKGIIHRDIKPSNVLVAEYDDRAVPKIIDFGVAKAVEQRLTEKTMFTQLGQVVGTVDYMSPEQAKLNQLDIDTRSDIYSLGVLLYELLTGETPFDRERLRSAAFDELLRIIREEDPPKPSLRLSSCQSLASIAANRRIEPRKLSMLIRGELDWIAMKALEKDRTRRYETANGFGADVRRYLNDQRVHACPPSAGYRFRKFARRNKASLTTIVLVMAALVVGTGVSIWQSVRATRALLGEREARTATQRQHERAEEEAQRAHRLAEERQRFVAETQQLLYVSDIKLAAGAWRKNDTRQLLQLLERHRPAAGKPDFRGFEWYFLWKQGRATEAEPVDQGDSVYSIRVSPNGRLIAVAGRDAVVRLYDGATFELRTELHTNQGEVNMAAFSPDGKILASSGDDGTVQFWSIEDEKIARSFAAHPGKVFSAVFLPDGSRLATCGDDPVIRLWNPNTGELVDTLEGHDRDVEAISISPDGQMLASASSDSTVRLWDLRTGQTVHVMHCFNEYISPYSCVLFSADGKYVVAGAIDGSIGVWDVEKGSLLQKRSHPDGVQSMAFSPTGQWIAAGDRGGVIRCWSLEEIAEGQSYEADSGEQAMRKELAASTDPLVSWQAHDRRVYALAFSRSGDRILSAGRDGNVFAWSHFEPATAETLNHPWDIWDIVFAPGTSKLISVGERGSFVWDLRERPSRFALAKESCLQSCAVCSRDGKLLAIGDVDGTIQLWDLTTRRQRASWRLQSASVSRLALSPSGRELACISSPNRKVIRFFDVDTGELASTLPASVIDAIAFSPDGRYLAANSSNDVQVWDVADRSLVRTVGSHSDTVNDLAFSPDGKWIASASNDRSVRLWDWRADDEPVSLIGHHHDVTRLAFSPDGQTLATAGRDGHLKLWNVPTGQPLLDVTTDEGSIRKVAFDSSGRRLAWLKSSSGLVKVFEVPSPDEVMPAAQLTSVSDAQAEQKKAPAEAVENKH